MVMRIRHGRYPGILWPEFKVKAMTSNGYSMINPRVANCVRFQNILVIYKV